MAGLCQDINRVQFMFTMSLDVVPPSIAYLNIGLIIGKLKIFVYTRIKYNIFFYFSLSVFVIYVLDQAWLFAPPRTISRIFCSLEKIFCCTLPQWTMWLGESVSKKKLHSLRGPLSYLRLKGTTAFSFYASKLEKSCTIQIIPPRLKQTFKVCM